MSEMLHTISSQRNLFKVIVAERIIDVYAYPYFLGFVDANLVTDPECIAILLELFADDDENESPQLLVNDQENLLPKELLKFCKSIDFETISEQDVRSIILKKHEIFEGKRSIEFVIKIKRLIDMFNNFYTIEKQNFIKNYKISESTFKRDYNLVKKIKREDIGPCKRDERILLIYKLKELNNGIVRSEFCSKHNISLRTLNRDLKTLSEATGYVFDYDDYRDFYY